MADKEHKEPTESEELEDDKADLLPNREAMSILHLPGETPGIVPDPESPPTDTEPAPIDQ